MIVLYGKNAKKFFSEQTVGTDCQGFVENLDPPNLIDCFLYVSSALKNAKIEQDYTDSEMSRIRFQ